MNQNVLDRGFFPSRPCERWAVTTTIFPPSEAVKRQTRLQDWCLVVAGDKKSHETYETGWEEGEEEGNAQVVYLTPKMQEAMQDQFVSALPWNHFGRKNAGFLYAMLHGASVIWDFDDDNLLKYWIQGAAPTNSLSLDGVVDAITNSETVDVLEPSDHGLQVYNPYPVLGAPTLPS